MNKANECTCPSGDGSLRWPCPAHPEQQVAVAAKLTFINGRPAMCGCQVEYSDGGGEYSDVIYVTLCAKHSGSAILDLVATNRIALTPEYEGQWHADLYLDREIPLAKVEGATPAEAVLALMSAERIDPEQESVEQAGGDERAAVRRLSEEAESTVIGMVEYCLNARVCLGMDEGFKSFDPEEEHDFVKELREFVEGRAALAQPSPDAPYADDIAADLERSDWTPEDALRWYAAGKHFDTTNGRTRIIDTGAVASNALKHLSLPYLEMKGDAELTELREAFAQPSPAQAECIDCHGSGFCMSISNEEIRCPCGAPIKFSGPSQAEAERPEMSPERAAYFMRRFKSEEKLLGPNEQAAVDYMLSLLAQHERIVGPLRYKAELYDEVWALVTGKGYMNVTTAISVLESERDAALARVAELDQALAEKDPFGAKLNRISEKLERCDALLAARAAQAGQVPDILTEDDMKWLRRFAECCEDSDAGGHDLPKAAVKQLVQIGALRHSGSGRQETTAFGDWLLDTTPVQGGFTNE
ncbi:TPA: hypothetical protein ACRDQR_000602 [Pseudomonas aeruginosa]